MSSYLKPTAALMLAAALLFAVGSVAFAHAKPQRYDPTPGSHLSQPPSVVQIWFDQPVEQDLSSFQVLDRARNRADAATPLMLTENGQHVIVELKPNLKPGVYTVLWKVVSAEDGHLTKGTYAFVIERTTAPAATPVSGGTVSATPEPTVDLGTATVTTDTTEEETTPSPLDIAVRWFNFALAALLIGGAAFAGLVSSPAAAALGKDEATTVDTRFTHAFIIFGIIIGGLLVLGQVFELLAQVARINEVGIGQALASWTAISATLGSGFGLYLKLKLAVALAIPAVLLIALALDRPLRAWLVVIILGGLYYLAEAMSGHEAAVSSAAGAGTLARLAPAADWLHLMSTAFWLGGLGYFLIILLPRLHTLTPDARRIFLAKSVERFSPIALTCVVLLIISGSVSMFAHDPTVDTLLNTDWGRALLVKFALLALLIGMGALNMFVTRPRLNTLRTNDPAAFAQTSRGFRWMMGGEVTVAAAVLIFAAILTLSSPISAAQPAAPLASSAYPTAVAQANNPTPAATLTPSNQPTATLSPPLVLTQTVRGVNVLLATQTGSDADKFRIQLADPTGHPPANVQQVEVRLTLLDQLGAGNGTDILLADDSGGGSYAVPDAPYLTLAGKWQAVVVARIKDQASDVKAAFSLDLAADGQLSGHPSEYLTAAIITDPSPPRSGVVTMTIKLTDANGNPVNDATLTVQGIMPSHGHIADPMTPTRGSSGEYRGTVFMRMKGGWDIDITVQRPGKETTVTEASLDVAASDLDLTPYPSPQFTPAP